MNVFYLTSIIIGVAAQHIGQKEYNKRTDGSGKYLFGVIMSLAAAIFFVLTSGGLSWNASILPYSTGFAASYGLATASGVAAVACGSLSLTTLITSYSLMVPTLYGLIFLREPVGAGFYPGIILLVLSLFFINKTGKGEAISLKWVICVTLSFIGNGMCSVVQKMQQVASGGAYKNEFMIIALIMVAISMLALSLKNEGARIKTYAKRGWYAAVLSGVFNGIVNLFVMILSGKMPVAIMFPLISAGGIILTYVISRFIYKEELSKTQLAGFMLGVASVIFLNI